MPLLAATMGAKTGQNWSELVRDGVKTQGKSGLCQERRLIFFRLRPATDLLAGRASVRLRQLPCGSSEPATPEDPS